MYNLIMWFGLSVVVNFWSFKSNHTKITNYRIKKKIANEYKKLHKNFQGISRDYAELDQDYARRNKLLQNV